MDHIWRRAKASKTQRCGDEWGMTTRFNLLKTAEMHRSYMEKNEGFKNIEMWR